MTRRTINNPEEATLTRSVISRAAWTNNPRPDLFLFGDRQEGGDTIYFSIFQDQTYADVLTTLKAVGDDAIVNIGGYPFHLRRNVLVQDASVPVDNRIAFKALGSDIPAANLEAGAEYVFASDADSYNYITDLVERISLTPGPKGDPGVPGTPGEGLASDVLPHLTLQTRPGASYVVLNSDYEMDFALGVPMSAEALTNLVPHSDVEVSNATTKDPVARTTSGPLVISKAVTALDHLYAVQWTHLGIGTEYNVAVLSDNISIVASRIGIELVLKDTITTPEHPVVGQSKLYRRNLLSTAATYSGTGPDTAVQFEGSWDRSRPVTSGITVTDAGTYHAYVTVFTEGNQGSTFDYTFTLAQLANNATINFNSANVSNGGDNIGHPFAIRLLDGYIRIGSTVVGAGTTFSIEVVAPTSRLVAETTTPNNHRISLSVDDSVVTADAVNKFIFALIPLNDDTDDNPIVAIVSSHNGHTGIVTSTNTRYDVLSPSLDSVTILDANSLVSNGGIQGATFPFLHDILADYPTLLASLTDFLGVAQLGTTEERRIISDLPLIGQPTLERQSFRGLLNINATDVKQLAVAVNIEYVIQIGHFKPEDDTLVETFDSKTVMGIDNVDGNPLADASFYPVRNSNADNDGFVFRFLEPGLYEIDLLILVRGAVTTSNGTIRLKCVKAGTDKSLDIATAGGFTRNHNPFDPNDNRVGLSAGRQKVNLLVEEGDIFYITYETASPVGSDGRAVIGGIIERISL